MKKKPRITGQYQPHRPVWPWLVALTAALLFMWLGYESMERQHKSDEELTQAILNQMRHPQVAYTPEQRRYEIMQLFNISDDEVAKPVNLFEGV